MEERAPGASSYLRGARTTALRIKMYDVCACLCVVVLDVAAQ